MEIGQTVTINGTNSVWDGKQGVIEDIIDDVATVFVDFEPEEGKKVRQDFNLENLSEVNESYGYHWHPSRASRQAFAQKMDDIDSFCQQNGISQSSSSDSYYFTINGHDYRVSNHSPEASYANSHGRYHQNDGSGDRDKDVTYINAGKTRIEQIYNDLKAGKKLDGNGNVKEEFDTMNNKKHLTQNESADNMSNVRRDDMNITPEELEKKMTKAQIAELDADVAETLTLKTSLKEAKTDNNTDRVTLLAKEVGVDPDDIKVSDYDDEVYLVEDESWLVVTKDEAHDRAEESIKETIDDVGLDAFTDDFQEYILSHLLKDSALYDIVHESQEETVNELEDEDGGDFDNGLISTLYDEKYISDDDFEKNEDDEPDYSKIKLSEDDIENLKEKYIDDLSDNTDPVDYIKDISGDGKDLWDFLDDNQLIDEAGVVEECINEDGVAHFIGSYDEVEHDLGDGLFAYRLE